MANSYFMFKQFTVFHDRCAFKVGTDGVLLGAYADAGAASRILDIGTGSGLIALMIAQRSDADIYAIEPDQESFIQAGENFNRSPWSSRITPVNCFLQDFNPASIKFDLIVSNPPFFASSLRNPDSRKASARHNFNLSGKELLFGVNRLLSSDGHFEVVIPVAEGNRMIEEASQYGLFCNKLLQIKSNPSSDIIRLIITFSREKGMVLKEYLTLEKSGRHEFTEEYMSLTRDYYLKF